MEKVRPRINNVLKTGLVAGTLLLSACGDDSDSSREDPPTIYGTEEEVDHKLYWQHVHYIRTQGDDDVSRFVVQFRQQIEDPARYYDNDGDGIIDGSKRIVAEPCLGSTYSFRNGADTYSDSESDLIVVPSLLRMPELRFDNVGNILVPDDTVTAETLALRGCNLELSSTAYAFQGVE